MTRLAGAIFEYLAGAGMMLCAYLLDLWGFLLFALVWFWFAAETTYTLGKEAGKRKPTIYYFPIPPGTIGPHMAAPEPPMMAPRPEEPYR